MNKNTLYRLYSAAFIGICLVPAVCMPFVKADSSKEKRQLAEKPHIKSEDGGINTEFFAQFDDWFSEHFAFRQQMVNADGRLKSTVFGTSPNSDVIAGKDGWLYYGETADDFLRINTLSQRAVNNIRHNFDLVNDYCQQNNIKLLFFSAPNKNTLYPEYMPKNYIPTDSVSNYEALSAALSDRDYYINMKDALQMAEASIPLYHKTDTHWNNMGAYVGHTALMGALGRESCPTGEWTARNDRLGDLAVMIYPSEEAKDMQIYGSYEYTYQYLGHFRALDDMNIQTSCENGQGALTMYRDSYGEAILPFMAECFESADFSRSVPYRIDGLSDRTLIIEIVERNIGNLQRYAPLMTAPEADISGFSITGCDEDITVGIEQNGSYLHIFGELPESMAGSDDRIFITVNGISREAFNCFEDKLLGREGENSDRGFSAYIPYTENIGEVTVTAAETGSESGISVTAKING